MGELAEVVLPGYGVCTLNLGNGLHEFIADTADTFRCGGGKPRGVKSLTLQFFEIENPDSLPNFLHLVCRSLQSLTIEMQWPDRKRCVTLGAVASACPQLIQLFLVNFQVNLSPNEELQNWELHKLTIHGSGEVMGLADCLGDPAYRISRELVELEITLPRSIWVSADYISGIKGFCSRHERGSLEDPRLQ
ncbi:unnamed protein product [Phytophthora lilii]|uniref:Unnamed protein product n=1 Tax=Phytophthora lilii TaxID=2077276 RepID=A0A9W7D7K8_9STRA|nr:unnamed protein product [Phytophthora lilii]